MLWCNHIGNFKDAAIIASGNNLTRLDQRVFGPLLQQMVAGKGGIVFGGIYTYFLTFIIFI